MLRLTTLLVAASVATTVQAPPRQLLGRSYDGRPIEAVHVGGDGPKVLVVGCIHGNECEGLEVTRLLERAHAKADLWLVPNLNPDGYARGTRQNARGVDLNRNFGAMWKPLGRPGDPQHSGGRPFSERETTIARKLILRLRPAITIWFHQPQSVVRAWGGSRAVARRYARLADVTYRSLPWPNGTAPNWQNHRGERSFVVELPPGELPNAAAQRYADAVVALAG